MADKDKKSFIIAPTEVKNYDIQDIYDLEDCLDVLESIVEDLKKPDLKKSELSTVTPKQFLAKYIYMEDSILLALDKLPKLASTKEMQQRILDATQTFNKLTFEYQETWDSDLWSTYEHTRNPLPQSNDFHIVKSHQQLSKQMQDLQEIAITLTRLSRGNTDRSSPAGKDPFLVVDEETLKYREPTVLVESKKDCSVCFVF